MVYLAPMVCTWMTVHFVVIVAQLCLGKIVNAVADASLPHSEQSHTNGYFQPQRTEMPNGASWRWLKTLSISYSHYNEGLNNEWMLYATHYSHILNAFTHTPPLSSYNVLMSAKHEVCSTLDKEAAWSSLKQTRSWCESSISACWTAMPASGYKALINCSKVRSLEYFFWLRTRTTILK